MNEDNAIEKIVTGIGAGFVGLSLWGTGEGAAILSAAFLAGTIGAPLLIGGGILLVGIGVYEFVNAGSPAPSVDADAPPIQIGPVPEGVNPSDPPITPVDVNSLPDEPPTPPPICPVGPPPICPTPISPVGPPPVCPIEPPPICPGVA